MMWGEGLTGGRYMGWVNAWKAKAGKKRWEGGWVDEWMDLQVGCTDGQKGRKNGEWVDDREMECMARI
jgi:hypothetical protein